MKAMNSDSDTVDLPTPLRKDTKIHHVSSMEHALFNPAPVSPRNTPKLTQTSMQMTILRPTDINIPASTPECSEDEEEEEDFQTVPLDDEH